jgi:hypothetical protein
MALTSDANGNYDRAGLPPDRYVVALVLRAEHGAPAQEPITVDLGADAIVVQQSWATITSNWFPGIRATRRHRYQACRKL